MYVICPNSEFFIQEVALKITIGSITIYLKGPFLQIWINFNPSMDT